MDNLGKRLEALRKSKRMSQKEFADMLKVTQTTIGNYERNDRIPDSDFIQNVVKEFGTNYDWLLEGKGEMYGVQSAVVNDVQNSAYAEALLSSNNHLNLLVGMLIEQVKQLGGKLPAGMGKLMALNTPVSPLQVVHEGASLGATIGMRA